MNLIAYDMVEPNIYLNTWISPIYKKCYSRTIEYHKYYCFLKRFDNKTKSTDWFIALLDNKQDNVIYHSTIRNKENLIKIDLLPIWYKTSLINIKENSELILEEVQKDNDGIVYQLMI